MRSTTTHHLPNDMQTLKAVIAIAWLVFWGYWLVSAAGAKASVKRRGWRPLAGISVLAVLLLTRVIKGGGFVVHSPILGAIGAVVFACGIALAVWARVYLGSNWGMPMSQRVEPELITQGHTDSFATRSTRGSCSGYLGLR